MPAAKIIILEYHKFLPIANNFFMKIAISDVVPELVSSIMSLTVSARGRNLEACKPPGEPVLHSTRLCFRCLIIIQGGVIVKNSLLRRSFRAGTLAALLLTAGSIVSLLGCVPPRGRVIVEAPSLVLPAPPFLYVIPGTYAYFAADVDVDIFFYQGFWYRPHLGRWYRAHEYNGPWSIIVTNRVPVVLRKLPPAYRRVSPADRLPHDDVRKNWRTWERERYWDRHDERKRERYDDEDRGRNREYDRGRNDNRDRDRDRYDYPDNRGRDPGPRVQPLLPQEQLRDQYQQQQREEHQYQDRNDDRDRDNNRDQERGRDGNERRGQESYSEPGRRPVQPFVPQQGRQQPSPQREERQGQIKDEDRGGGKDRDRNERRGQESYSEPARQVTQPQEPRQEQQQAPPQLEMRRGQERPSGPARQMTQPQAPQQEPPKKQDRKKDKDQEKDEEKDSAPAQNGDEGRRDERGQGRGKNR